MKSEEVLKVLNVALDYLDVIGKLQIGVAVPKILERLKDV
jgi:hypothetical protein